MSGWDNRYDVDAWNADVLAEGTIKQELPRSLAELRDGIAPPAPNQGAARQARIKRMEHEVALCADFVADCDRYRDALNAYPDPCLTPLVSTLMGQYLAKRRRQAVATMHRLCDELAVLRGGT